MSKKLKRIENKIERLKKELITEDNWLMYKHKIRLINKLEKLAKTVK